MKLLLALFICCINTAVVHAHSASWEWAKSGTNAGGANTRGVSVDGAGNTYAIGWFNSSVTFGAATFTCMGTANAYLLKYSPSGTLLWAHSILDSGLVDSYAIAADANGDVYIAGSFSRTAIFDSISITSKGGADVFLAKYNSTGVPVWVRAQGTQYNDALPGGLGIDSHHNIIIGGYFSSIGSITFGGFTFTSYGDTDIFLAKYDSSGQVIWARQAGDKLGEYLFDLAVDKSDNIVIVGSFNYHIAFDSITISSISKGLVVGDVFLAKYDSSGKALWALPIGGDRGVGDIEFGGVDARLAAVDTSGNVFIGGVYTNCYLKIGGMFFPPPSDLDVGTYDMWFAKYSPSGDFMWAKTAGSLEPDYLHGMATDKQGNLYVTGEYGYTCGFDGDTARVSPRNPDYNNMFVCKYDPAGKLLALNTIAADAGTAGYDVAVGNKGEVTVVGTFGGPALKLGASTLYNGGSNNGFVARMGAPTGIQPVINGQADFSIYPNPATDKITIRLNGNAAFTRYTLVDAVGRLITAGLLTAKPQQAIPLPSVPGGLYYLRLSGQNATAAHKLHIIR